MVLIKHSCNATTKVGPYAALTTVLNLILAWTVRDEPNNDPDIIFVTNYPTVVRSSLLRRSAKRKPDIVCVPLRVLREWMSSDYDELRFEDLIVLLAQGNIPFDPTRSWCDIDQFVEVEKHLAKLNTDFLNHQYSRQDLTNIVLGKNTPRLRCI